jgi:predicted ATP-dependent protease
VEKRLQEMIGEGSVLVDVQGAVVGQVNGLAVYQLGDFSFGKPSRITAKTFMGRGGIVNIEREAKLSGKTHDKGVLILSGYLGGKYAQQTPLSLSSSICFEQSYDGVDGDSASSCRALRHSFQPCGSSHRARHRRNRFSESERRDPGHRRY